MARQGWQIGNFGSSDLGLVVIDTFQFLTGVESTNQNIGVPIALRGATTNFDYSHITNVNEVHPEIITIGNVTPFGEDFTSYRPILSTVNPSNKTFGITWALNPNTPAGSFFGGNAGPLGYICYVKAI